MNEDQKYIVNTNYMLKNDIKRIYISYRHHPVIGKPKYYTAEKDFFSFIHPDQAKILALFDGKRTLSEIIDKISERLNTSKEHAKDLIKPFIENKKRLGAVYKGNEFVFPKNIIVPFKEDTPLYSYSEDQFNCSATDFKQHRIYTFPIDITLMVNTVCLVDCIYCYADCRKKFDCKIPLDRLEKLISDCRKNDVRSIDLMGGEVLMYKEWYWLLKTMTEYGFTPFVSTKIPIDSNVIDRIYDLGLRQFQISLDSFDGNIIGKNLNIPNGKTYIEKMRRTLKMVEEKGISLNIHAVITKHNKDITHLQQYIENLSQFSNINHLQLSIASKSLYKTGYEDFRLNKDDIDQLSVYVSSIAKDLPFEINFTPGLAKESYCSSRKEKSTNFKKRGLCGANVRQAFILPDGNVTICEELMFNPKFYLGNIITDDFKQVWDNNRIKYLFNKDSHENSKCGKCKNFDDCKSYEAKGVCWKEVFHAYGEEKWNYPDPKCPHAPKKMNNFYIV